MNKKISRAIILSELARLSTISDPGNIFASCLQFTELISLRAIANREQMNSFVGAAATNLEGTK